MIKKTPITNQIPLLQDLDKFAVDYTPEVFSSKEKEYLIPFFSNLNKPIFAVSHLPEEVIGALSSRYSRSTKSLRRMFLDEYVDPIVNPAKQKSWLESTAKEKKEKLELKKKFLATIKFLNRTGGIEAVVNVQRGRAFFDKWLAEYGDDSIAELGGVHLFLEGVSNVAVNEIQAKRVGLSPLEKSSRYVSFAAKMPNGKYQYVVPGEIKGKPMEKDYRAAMDLLFDTYVRIMEPYLEYIKLKYPAGVDETPVSFQNSRAAKRFDDIRDLLPFATRTNLALYGNGRAFEDLINRMAAHPLGEIRWWAKMICDELEKVVPSFVQRPKTERGAQVQTYRNNLRSLKQNLVKEINKNSSFKFNGQWAKLLNYSSNAPDKILSSFLSSESQGPLENLHKNIAKLSAKKKKEIFEEILKARKMGNLDAPRQEVRFRKVPRAFENAHYTYELWARGGDYRDLHRHRVLTQERQLFTTDWGFDLEPEVKNSEFYADFEKAFSRAVKIYQKLSKINPYLAQYAVPYGFLQHWYITISAREIYWIGELRTGPQGRPHYRKISQQIVAEAQKIDPLIFSGVMVDWNDYSLSRRESEKKIEQKLKSIK